MPCLIILVGQVLALIGLWKGSGRLGLGNFLEGCPSERVDGIKMDSNMNPGTNIVPFIDESEVNDQSSSEEYDLKKI